MLKKQRTEPYLCLRKQNICQTILSKRQSGKRDNCAHKRQAFRVTMRTVLIRVFPIALFVRDCCSQLLFFLVWRPSSSDLMLNSLRLRHFVRNWQWLFDIQFTNHLFYHTKIKIYQLRFGNTNSDKLSINRQNAKQKFFIKCVLRNSYFFNEMFPPGITINNNNSYVPSFVLPLYIYGIHIYYQLMTFIYN